MTRVLAVGRRLGALHVAGGHWRARRLAGLAGGRADSETTSSVESPSYGSPPPSQAHDRTENLSSSGPVLRSSDKWGGLSPVNALSRRVTASLQRSKEVNSWDALRELWDHPDPVSCETCNYMLNVCAQGRKPELALEIFRLMEAKGVAPNVVSYSCLVRAFSRGGRVEEAVTWLENLAEAAAEGRADAPNLVMFNSVLNGCAYAVNQSLADRCLALMHRQGTALDSESYAELLKLGGLAGDLILVHKWWKELLSVLGKPCHVAQNAYITALARCGDLNLAVSALHSFCEAALHRQLAVPSGKYRGLLRQKSSLTSSYSRREVGLISGGREDSPAKQLVEGEEGHSPRIRERDAELYKSTNKVQVLEGRQQGVGLDVSTVSSGEDVAVEGGQRGQGDGGLREREKGETLEGWWNSGLVDSLEEWVQKEMVIAYNAVVNQAARIGDYQLAVKLISQMLDGGLKLDNYSYNAWMRAAAKGGTVDDTLHVWKSMQAGGFQPNRHSHEALLHALCNEGRLEEAEQLLQEMAQKGHKMAPSKHAYNALLDAWTAQGDPSKAMSIYQWMRDACVPPDVCTFLSLFSACTGPRYLGADSGNWAREEAVKRVALIEGEMKKAGVRHTAATYAAMLQLLGREAQIEVMLERLKEAGQSANAHNRPLLDAVTFNVAIDACIQAGKMDKAMEVFKQMEAIGVSPTRVTYNTLINGCSFMLGKPSQMTLAFELADAMKEKGITSDVVTYNSLLKVVCHGGEVDVGLQLLVEMQSRGVSPDHISFNTLLAAASHHNRLDIVELCLEHMHRCSVTPDSTACCLAVAAYVSADRHSDAVEALHMLSARMMALSVEGEPECENKGTTTLLNTSKGIETVQGRPASGISPLVRELDTKTQPKHASIRVEEAETAEELLEIAVMCDDPAAMADYMRTLAGSLDGREREWRAERSPLAARLRILYGRRMQTIGKEVSYKAA